MARGYQVDDIRKKITGLLSSEPAGMSGIEIASRLRISRTTITKYLEVFATEGIIRRREMGNLTLWSIDSESEQYSFPDDYFRVAGRYAEYLLQDDGRRAESLIADCMRSSADSVRLVSEVLIPAIDSVRKLYEDGKIGDSEQRYLEGIVSRSLGMLPGPLKHDPGRNVIILATDRHGVMLGRAAEAAYRTRGWRVTSLGDMSSSINVIFDIDLQKLLRRVWKGRQGLMVILVISSSREGLEFFAESVKAIDEKNLKVILCGDVGDIPKGAADLLAGDVMAALQWSDTVSDGQS